MCLFRNRVCPALSSQPIAGQDFNPAFPEGKWFQLAVPWKWVKSKRFYFQEKDLLKRTGAGFRTPSCFRKWCWDWCFWVYWAWQHPSRVPLAHCRGSHSTSASLPRRGRRCSSPLLSPRQVLAPYLSPSLLCSLPPSHWDWVFSVSFSSFTTKKASFLN